MLSGFEQITWKYAAAIVALISFVINLIVLTDYLKSPFSNFLLWDAASYWKWALEIAGGNWLGTSIFHQTPLYPYLLSFFLTIFGQNLLPIYIFQSLLSAASSALVCSTVMKITDNKWVGLLAGLLYSFYGMQVFYTTKILTECTAVFFALLTVRLLLSERFLISTLYSGISFGLLLLIKPHFLLAVPLILPYYFIRFKEDCVKHKLKRFVCFIIPMMLVVSVVTIRNYYVGKDLVAISSNGGENFYIGNHDKATGTYIPIEGTSSDIATAEIDIIGLANEQTGKQLTRSQVSKYWFGKGLSFIVNNPAEYLGLEWTKFKDAFSGVELVNMYVLKFEKKNLTQSLALPFVNFYLLFPLFFVGLVAAIKQWRKYYLIILMFLINILNILIFFYDSRFMVVAMPFMIMLSGTGLWIIYSKIFRAPSLKKAVYQPLTLVLVVGIFLLTSVYIRDKKFSDLDWRMWMSLGDIYYGLGQYDKSLELYIKSSGMKKDNCMPVFGACKALHKLGNTTLAFQIYNSTFEKIPPDDKRTILRDSDLDPLRK